MKKVLFIGYGIDKNRKEAVSINTLRTKKYLNSIGVSTKVLNIGYPNQKHIDIYTGKSMFDAIINRKKIVGEIDKFVKKEKFTHIHDVFVLPVASLLFVLPVKKSNNTISFFKELQNDSGFSKSIDYETLLRVLLNRDSQIKNIINCYDITLTRSKYLAMKRNIKLLPPVVEIHYANKRPSKILRFCYLGHPLKKKGVYLFPDIIKKLNALNLKNQVKFNFAFSDVGEKSKIESRIRKVAGKTNIQVNFFGEVKPHKFFRDNDVFLLPLLDDYGAISLPNTILESMEAGCLVMTTNTNSVQDVIINNKNGLIIKDLNIDSVIVKIKDIVENWNKYKPLTSRARESIVNEYNEARNKEFLKELYA